MQSDIKLRLLEKVIDKQYDAKRAAYIEKAKRGFDRHNAVMFLAYGGFLILNKRKPELIYFCWLVSALSVIDMVLAHMDMKERARKLLNVCYIFLLLVVLLFGKTVYRNELSMTVLICSAVTTSVLGIKVYTYVKVLLAAVLLDGLLYIAASLLFLEYETRWLILADDVLLCAFLVGVAVAFENLYCDIWKREAEKEDLLKQAFGAAGIVARLGGDEF